MARTLAVSSAAGTQALARPIAAASAPPTTRPVNIISLAFSGPTRRGSRWLMPHSGVMPHLPWVSAKRASSAQTSRSPASASSSPPV
jgi:hypothetical protein